MYQNLLSKIKDNYFKQIDSIEIIKEINHEKYSFSNVFKVSKNNENFYVKEYKLNLLLDPKNEIQINQILDKKNIANPELVYSSKEDESHILIFKEFGSKFNLKDHKISNLSKKLSEMMIKYHQISREDFGQVAKAEDQNYSNWIKPHYERHLKNLKENSLKEIIEIFENDNFTETLFNPKEFNLCHQDIYERNLRELKNGELGLIDWGLSGFYCGGADFRGFHSTSQWLNYGEELFFSLTDDFFKKLPKLRKDYLAYFIFESAGIIKKQDQQKKRVLNKIIKDFKECF